MKKSIGCLLVLAALGGEGVYAQPSPEGDAALTVRADTLKLTREEFIYPFNLKVLDLSSENYH